MSFNPHQYSAEHHDGAREFKGRIPADKLQGGKVTKHDQDLQLANQVTQHNIDKLKESTHKPLLELTSANSKVTAKSTVKAKTNQIIKPKKSVTSTKTVLKGVGVKPKKKII